MDNSLQQESTLTRYIKTIVKDWRLYVLLIPSIYFFFMWKYLPISGQLMAFKDYKIDSGVLGSDFAGFDFFKQLMFGGNAADFWRAFRNTFMLSFYGLLFGFPVPIILAIFFSEIKSEKYRSAMQIIAYLPKFISTVIITTLVAFMLSTPSLTNDAGVVAQFLEIFGIGVGDDGELFNILYDPAYFRAIYHISGIWEGAGYGSIIYFAAIMGIPTTSYEAAKVDGANKFEQIRYVTLPGISSTLTIMLILRLGSMFTIGFEKVLLLYSTSTYDTADVISTYVYRIGMTGGQTEVGSAADMFNGLICMVLVVGANFIAKKVSDTSLY